MERFSLEGWAFEALCRIALFWLNAEFGFIFRIALSLVYLHLALVCVWSSFFTYARVHIHDRV